MTARLWIGDATLRAINPRLLYCSSTAFGTRGIHRGGPAYDPVLQSLSGMAKDNVQNSGAVQDYLDFLNDPQVAAMEM